jgi:hypothetical protein
MRLARFFGVALFALLLGCAEPVPSAKAQYVGDWQAPNMRLMIRPDGMISYERKRDSASTTINAPIQRFEGDNFVVGFGPFSTTFVVSRPPHLDGAAWKMTVDGVELVRRSGPSQFNT